MEDFIILKKFKIDFIHFYEFKILFYFVLSNSLFFHIINKIFFKIKMRRKENLSLLFLLDLVEIKEKVNIEDV